METKPNSKAEVLSKDALYKKYQKLSILAALRDIVQSRAVYIMAIVIPLLIMIIVFAVRKIFPFGDEMYLRSDMYHQYCPFFTDLWYKIRNGESLFYSWDFGMGTNFTAVYGYYLSSPSNWFIALFPQDWIIEIMNIIILLKISAASFTCTFYLCKHRGRIHMSAAIFGMFYALSAYIAAYSWNLMWLDCVLLLPLIVLGLERLVRGEDCLMYIISLGLAILSNYYIAIMVCLSLVIYFVVYMISMPTRKNKADYLYAGVRFALSSILAGCMAAVLLLPEMCALGYTASSNTTFPKVWENYYSFFTIMKRELLNVTVSTGLDHMPNIYCGVAVLVLYPLYIMTRKISFKEKVAKSVALIIFFLAYNLNIMNYVWHGFHYPNSLPCRQSFIYIFLLLSICYDAVVEFREYKKSQLTTGFWVVMLFLVYVANTLTDGDAVNYWGVLFTALFIALYMLFMVIARKKKVESSVVTLIVYVIAIVEVVTNMINTGYSTTTRSAYFRDKQAVASVLDYMNENDTDFYRTAKSWGYRTKNDSAWHHFNGPSTFSSTAYDGVTKLFGQLGLEHSMNAYATNGATPLVYSMLGVRYQISNKIIKSNELTPFLYGTDGEFLYFNEHCLPIGYMVPENLNDIWDYNQSKEPFAVQNSFVEATTGIEDVFTPVVFTDNSTNITIVPDKDQFLYVYIKNTAIKSAKVTINGESETFTGIDHGRMIDLGYVTADSTITVSNSTEDSTDALNCLVYTMNEDKFISAMDILNEQGLDVTAHSSASLSGTIEVKEDGMLFTSIPYDLGWTVKVDGRKVPIRAIADNAFIGIELASGTHTIEFSYMPTGFVPGLLISILSFAIVGGMIYLRVRTKKQAEGTLLRKKRRANKEDADASDEVIDEMIIESDEMIAESNEVIAESDETLLEDDIQDNYQI